VCDKRLDVQGDGLSDRLLYLLARIANSHADWQVRRVRGSVVGRLLVDHDIAHGRPPGFNPDEWRRELSAHVMIGMVLSR
jgi:hypothetical protein